MEELLAERGLAADHTTVWRWLQRYDPELEQRLHRHLKPTNQSWITDTAMIVDGGMNTGNARINFGSGFSDLLSSAASGPMAKC